MNSIIVTCTHCGVMLNHEHLNWPDLSRVKATDENSEYIGAGRGRVPRTSCPVCQNSIIDY